MSVLRQNLPKTVTRFALFKKPLYKQKHKNSFTRDLKVIVVLSDTETIVK